MVQKKLEWQWQSVCLILCWWQQGLANRKEQYSPMALRMSIEDGSDYRWGMGKERGALSIFLDYMILEAYDI